MEWRSEHNYAIPSVICSFAVTPCDWSTKNERNLSTNQKRDRNSHDVLRISCACRRKHVFYALWLVDKKFAQRFQPIKQTNKQNKTNKQTNKTNEKKRQILLQEPMSRRIRLPYQAYVTAFIQVDLFSVYLFFSERKALPVSWQSDVK